MNRLTKVVCLAATLLLAVLPAHAGKPLIGISCSGDSGNSGIGSDYYNAIAAAGGIPVLLPCTKDTALIGMLVGRIDGIMFTGGEDYDPALFGEERIPELGTVNGFRDTSDFAYARMALKQRKPILGICRGEQLLNIVLGGTLYQDLPSQTGKTSHSQNGSGKKPCHGMTIDRNSILHKIIGRDSVIVNTSHHQAVKQLGEGLRVTAVSDDGVVEAFESTDRKMKVLAVQFHPERLRKEDSIWTGIFRWLVREADLQGFPCPQPSIFMKFTWHPNLHYRYL